MFGKRVTRYALIAAMILVGVSFIALIMSNFDVTAETLMAELLAIFILLVVLMGAACLAALGLRALGNRDSKSKRDDER
jgi:hypothetical protein